MSEVGRISLDVPGTGQYLGILQPCIREMLAGVQEIHNVDSVTQSIHLAVHEAAANVVRHAYAGGNPGRIQISLILMSDPYRLIAEMRDTGQSFDPSTVPEPSLDKGQIHGYGLHLIRTVMDDVTYEAGAHGNRWRLLKYL